MYQDGSNEQMRLSLINHRDIFIALANYEPRQSKSHQENLDASYEGGEGEGDELELDDEEKSDKEVKEEKE